MPEPAEPLKDPSVTVIISRRVKPGREDEFEAFLSGITAACMKYSGHLGTNIFRPTHPAEPEYRIIFKFDRLSNLQQWETSRERQQWFALAETLTQGPPQIQVLTGLETWFTLPGQATLTPPPRYKMALVTWLAVFPLITGISTLLKTELEPLPLTFRTLIVTAIAVPTLTYVIMPRMTRLFARWLYPSPADSMAEPMVEAPFALESADVQPLAELQLLCSPLNLEEAIQEASADVQTLG